MTEQQVLDRETKEVMAQLMKGAYMKNRQFIFALKFFRDYAKGRGLAMTAGEMTGEINCYETELDADAFQRLDVNWTKDRYNVWLSEMEAASDSYYKKFLQEFRASYEGWILNY